MANEEKRGGSGNFSQDRERASEAGRRAASAATRAVASRRARTTRAASSRGRSREGMQDNQSDQKKKDWYPDRNTTPPRP